MPTVPDPDWLRILGGLALWGVAWLMIATLLAPVLGRLIGARRHATEDDPVLSREAFARAQRETRLRHLGATPSTSRGAPRLRPTQGVRPDLFLANHDETHMRDAVSAQERLRHIRQQAKRR